MTLEEKEKLISLEGLGYFKTKLDTENDNKFVAKNKLGDGLKVSADGTVSVNAEGLTVDSELSDISTNSVQNKVIKGALDQKVDVVDGKGLSTNDYTNEDKTKLASIATGAEVNVQSDWSVTDTASDAYILNKPTSLPADGGNADTVGGHTVDIDVPANAKFTDTVYDDTAIKADIANKVDAVDGKGLSTNDYTTVEKTKLEGIADGATAVNEETVSGWGFTKNTGTYIKPATGIPASDLASGVIPTTLPASDVKAWAKADSKPEYAWNEITDKPETFTPSAHNHDDRYYTEGEMDTKLSGKSDTGHTHTKSDITDFPTSMPASDVKAWAKADNKPTYTASEVGALANTITHLSGDIATTEKGAANGVATLGSDGKIPSGQLPSYVDDVLEYAKKSDFPVSGESGKIYVDKTTNLTWRWSGSDYTEISPSLALGETSSTAYAGDKGKALADKLAGIAAGAEVNIQSDWNVTDTTSDAYIKNKPTSLPANGGNAATVGGFTVGVNVPANAKFTDTVYDDTTIKADIAKKVDAVSGKGLSTNDYTTTEKTKLAGIATGAEVNVQSDWNVTDAASDAYIKNKPTIPSAVTESTVSGWGFTKNTGTYSKPSGGIPKTDLASAVQTSLGKADTALQEHQSLANYVKTDDSRLSDARTPKAHTHPISDITGFDFSDAMINRGRVDNTTDFNTLTDSGCYAVQATGGWGDAATKHSPNEYGGIYSYGLLLVLRPTVQLGGNRILQIYFPHMQDENTDPVLMRMHDGSTLDSGWHTWHRLSYNTWRGIQNNLTSDSTTESLSAAQGKALKGLVDGKADKSAIPTIDTALSSTSTNPVQNKVIKAAFDAMNTSSAYTLSASKWSGNTYSLESVYPAATYDIAVGLNGDTFTVAQKEAFDKAQLVGLNSTNGVKAAGDVPAIDIPVIIKAVKKK